MKMWKTLPQEKVRRLRQSLPEHPLLKACQVAFTPRIALLDGLMVEAEDIFCVVAEVFDSLLKEDHPTQEIVEDLWTNLVINIRRQWQSDASEKDRMVQTLTASDRNLHRQRSSRPCLPYTDPRIQTAPDSCRCRC